MPTGSRSHADSSIMQHSHKRYLETYHHLRLKVGICNYNLRCVIAKLLDNGRLHRRQLQQRCIDNCIAMSLQQLGVITEMRLEICYAPIGLHLTHLNAESKHLIGQQGI